ncbi:NAD-dependent epimerase/dehydratase family protein [Tuwongella immobilis]|uniref:3-beta hydroxysteroid dehydrogenase/isomerase domain-containing protein n=1 Tax=Tuwongella immobilis TaxID=692036 RepID=A0A6C2YPC4_9BACT|nr:NAD-dependent epimerase/dehydratase family protein [Tuwongella immobilis]VIP03207.1 3-beta hydroxysteroid dehydrogenase : 3-beta hydroxysteroid dehydrogenase/isomerase OS=Geobacter sp. (strain M18) GN=GM18_2133 PE=4 SV=1: 3Beta_HSD [Tuwongella immobilis]VTS03709.1 3-beta hydroxysteroid dehydrogenase : 3-beta hydroxysteroid dehydrogenase/isomerase OS=Geobacter sp. (strain M18) GN=GM18_2133 PE=4 SV=1: 3Beta_HSD [Tuwongella immobilis]
MSRVLVTGGGGFLGSAIVRQLRQRGVQVVSMSRKSYPELEQIGVQQISADLEDAKAVSEAISGCESVFHVAAKAGIWGLESEYHRANVVGTEHVIAACRTHGVKRLVFTSSPSVTFAGTDQEGVDESEPYPETYLAPYPKTKAIAERLALAANGATLAVVALRPHLIWGPGDPHLVPRLVERAKQGKLRRIGNRPNRVDTIFVENAAEAHLQAWERLAPGSTVAGKAYFLSQGEPMPLWDFINQILQIAGVPPVTRSIPAGLAVFAGGLLEWWYRTTGRRGEPPMTRFVARQLSTAHWFDLSAARRDFGYAPKISTAEGLRRLAESMRSPQA